MDLVDPDSDPQHWLVPVPSNPFLVENLRINMRVGLSTTSICLICLSV